MKLIDSCTLTFPLLCRLLNCFVHLFHLFAKRFALLQLCSSPTSLIAKSSSRWYTSFPIPFVFNETKLTGGNEPPYVPIYLAIFVHYSKAPWYSPFSSRIVCNTWIVEFSAFIRSASALSYVRARSFDKIMDMLPFEFEKLRHDGSRYKSFCCRTIWVGILLYERERQTADRTVPHMRGAFRQFGSQRSKYERLVTYPVLQLDIY